MEGHYQFMMLGFKSVGNFKSDTRSKRDGWAPGNYTCRCINCEINFSGDKRSCICSDCAYMNYSDRRTGKTFRVLLRALLAASEGKSTILITELDYKYLGSFLIPRALGVLQGYGVEYTYTRSGRVLSIVGGGSVKFVVDDHDQILRGYDPSRIFRDYSYGSFI